MNSKKAVCCLLTRKRRTEEFFPQDLRQKKRSCPGEEKRDIYGHPGGKWSPPGCQLSICGCSRRSSSSHRLLEASQGLAMDSPRWAGWWSGERGCGGAGGVEGRRGPLLPAPALPPGSVCSQWLRGLICMPHSHKAQGERTPCLLACLLLPTPGKLFARGLQPLSEATHAVSAAQSHGLGSPTAGTQLPLLLPPRCSLYHLPCPA